MVTLKAAIHGHFKTGHMDWPETRLFYLAAGYLGKARSALPELVVMFMVSGCVLWW